MPKARVGLVGCGALAESIYLPLLTAHPDYQITFLVDVSMARAQALASKYHVVSRFDNYQESIKSDAVDAVILALPNCFHAKATIDFLNAGIHVLVEKPMATCVADAQGMIDAAKANQKVLAVGLVRRFYASTQFIKGLIDRRTFGRLRSISIEEGNIFNWPIRTDSLINKKLSGGGVLMDIGAHVTDLILYWLGDIESLEYYDDNRGGVEAECHISFETKQHVLGSVKLSRLRNLKNVACLNFEGAYIEVGLAPNSSISLKFNSPYVFEATSDPELAPQNLASIFIKQLDNFYGAIASKEKVFVPGKEGVKSLAFIERCYRSAKPLSDCYQHY